MASAPPDAPLLATIVVGCDDGPGTADAARLAAELARLDGRTQLVLVHAHAPSVGRFGRWGRDDELDESLHGRGMALLEGVRDGLPSDLHDRVELLSLPVSSASYALHDIANGYDADLIVVGPASHGGLGRLLLGSSSTGVVDGAPCPVAIPPRTNGGSHEADATRAIGHLGVGYDGSPAADDALAFAARLAVLQDRPLDVVAAVDLAAADRPDPEALVPEPSGAEQLRERADALLGEQIARLPEAVRARPVVLDAEPIDGLADHSAELHLLVVGSRAHGPLRHVLLGSVARGVLDRARAPVIVVPRHREG